MTSSEQWSELALRAASGFFVQEPIEDESAFYQLARAHIDESSDLLTRALMGGLYADRFAWVFLAGYQPAIQHTFFDRAWDDWAAFAVSEDRAGKLPPLTWAAADDGFVLNGAKTWVAGVEHMRYLIVKAGRGAEARYFVVDRDHAGLSLSTKGEGFLAEMTEGIAQLRDVRVGHGELLDASQVKQFGTREFLYIYAAFCGMVIARCAHAELVGQAWGLLEQIRPLLDATHDTPALKTVDVGIQQIRTDAQPHMRNVAGWDNDQRLIAIYSKPIQARPD